MIRLEIMRTKLFKTFLFMWLLTYISLVNYSSRLMFQLYKRGSSPGVVVNMLSCGIVVSVFKLQSCY